MNDHLQQIIVYETVKMSAEIEYQFNELTRDPKLKQVMSILKIHWKSFGHTCADQVQINLVVKVFIFFHGRQSRDGL